jgi:hypothetical protein
MDSTVAVQTKGLGSSFQASRNSRMAPCNSSTPKNDPRRTRLEGLGGQFGEMFKQFPGASLQFEFTAFEPIPISAELLAPARRRERGAPRA